MTDISLNLPEIRRRRKDEKGTYGHEQRHVLNCRNMATQLANKLSLFTTDSIGECRGTCSKECLSSRRAFDKWFLVERKHLAGIPRPFADYLPIGEMPETPTGEQR